MGIIDLRYGMLFGFVGFALTLVGNFETGVLDPRFPAVIGAEFFLLEDFLVQ